MTDGDGGGQPDVFPIQPINDTDGDGHGDNRMTFVDAWNGRLRPTAGDNAEDEEETWY